jgi:hypothetical protein
LPAVAVCRAGPAARFHLMHAATPAHNIGSLPMDSCMMIAIGA